MISAGPAKLPQITEQMENLSRTVDEMEKAITALQQRLEPVLSLPESAPEVNQKVPTSTPLLAPLAVALAARIYALRSLISKVAELANRTEV